MCTRPSSTNSGSTRASWKSPAASASTWTTGRRSGRSSGNRLLLDRQVLHAEQPVVVGPDLPERQPGGHGQFAERLAGVLVRVLRADALAGSEPDRHAPN